MNLDLQNRTAVVCGSSQGIGKSIALELALLGANVVLVARDRGRLQAAQNQLDTSSGQRHQVLVADFSDPNTLYETLNAAIDNGLQAEILINNTGGPPPGTALAAKLTDYLAAFSAHLLCSQILAQGLVPHMKVQRFGRIVNVISTSVKQPLEGLGVSNTIRGAVANWSKTLANELGSFGITVNNVLPGMTRTGRLEQIIQQKSERQEISVEAVIAEMESEVPARRIGDPHEIAAAVAFLASPAASYINGINLPVDGGRTKCL